jgi:hypothetical protein
VAELNLHQRAVAVGAVGPSALCSGGRFLRPFTRHSLMACGLVGTMLVSVCAVAANSPSRAALQRHQVIICMNKRMAANTTISYNEAAKVCKKQVRMPPGLSARIDDAEVH